MRYCAILDGFSNQWFSLHPLIGRSTSFFSFSLAKKIMLWCWGGHHRPVIAFSSYGEDVGWGSTRAISSADVPSFSRRPVSSEQLVVKDVLISALS